MEISSLGNPRMRPLHGDAWRWTRHVVPIVVALSLLGFENRAAGGMGDSNLQELWIPLDAKSQKIASATEELSEALKTIRPTRVQAGKAARAANGSYVLYGDLFHTGRIFALVTMGAPSDSERNIGVGFAQWTGRRWKARGFLNINPAWLPKGAAPDPAVYYPIPPQKRPFWTMDFNAQGACGVVIVGRVWKYWQEHFLFKLDEKNNRLVPIEAPMGPPHLVDGWLRLDYTSGHRSIFLEWCFARWNGQRFTKAVSWHTETPYNNIDPEFIDVVLTESLAHKTTYRITHGNSDSEKELVYDITKNGGPFAHVYFGWAKPIDVLDGTSEVYLFRKLTHLPSSMFPDKPNYPVPPTHFKNVRVSGSHEAVRMLSP